MMHEGLVYVHIIQVDDMLEELSSVTKEESQLAQLTKICHRL